MHCHHCYGMMNEDKSMNVIDTFMSLTRLTNSINLAGGEVFMNIDELYEIVKLGVGKSVHLSIISNGFKLLNHLEDEKVLYILKHIYKLGISIDSFDDSTNDLIGRKTLDITKLVKLSSICRSFRTKLKINTVVTKHNLGESIVDKIVLISPNQWKIIEVYTKKEDEKISISSFTEFCFRNNDDRLNISIENAEKLTVSYVMINGKGNLFIDNNEIESVNVNALGLDKSINPWDEFYNALVQNGFNEEAYMSRYSSSKEAVTMDLRSFNKKANRRLNQGENILFIDVEGITPRPGEIRRNPILTFGFKALLYTGLIINNDQEIIRTVQDFLKPDDCIITKMYENDVSIFNEFYTKVARVLLDNNIGLIVVSGIETELSFFEELMLYAELKRDEFEKIRDLANNMFDIQQIKAKDILKMEIKKTSSRNVLQELNAYRSDLFPYTREVEKNEFSSKEVSCDLIKLYVDPSKNLVKQTSDIIDEILFYCLDDVFDDYKLFVTYKSMKNIRALRE